MWCCWISPDHNPASTQRRVRRAPNIGLRESRRLLRLPYDNRLPTRAKANVTSWSRWTALLRIQWDLTPRLDKL